MTMRETDRPTPPGVRADTDFAGYDRRWEADETKASFKTTELWAAIVGVVALIIVYNSSSDLSLDLFRTCLLSTVLGSAYIVSRGLAKSGSANQKTIDRDDRD